MLGIATISVIDNKLSTFVSDRLPLIFILASNDSRALKSNMLEEILLDNNSAIINETIKQNKMITKYSKKN